jgi:hypothetical protein
MPAYRCYFLDGNDRIIAISPPELIFANTDAGAVREAWSLCRAAPEGCEGIELWQGERFVLKRRLDTGTAS